MVKKFSLRFPPTVVVRFIPEPELRKQAKRRFNKNTSIKASLQEFRGWLVTECQMLLKSYYEFIMKEKLSFLLKPTFGSSGLFAWTYVSKHIKVWDAKGAFKKNGADMISSTWNIPQVESIK